jgi:hypothetical protein
MRIKMGFSLSLVLPTRVRQIFRLGPRLRCSSARAECFSTQPGRIYFTFLNWLARWRLVYGGSISINHPLWANYSNCYVARERASERTRAVISSSRSTHKAATWCGNGHCRPPARYWFINFSAAEAQCIKIKANDAGGRQIKF